MKTKLKFICRYLAASRFSLIEVLGVAMSFGMLITSNDIILYVISLILTWTAWSILYLFGGDDGSNSPKEPH